MVVTDVSEALWVLDEAANDADDACADCGRRRSAEAVVDETLISFLSSLLAMTALVGRFLGEVDATGAGSTIRDVSARNRRTHMIQHTQADGSLPVDDVTAFSVLSLLAVAVVPYAVLISLQLRTSQRKLRERRLSSPAEFVGRFLTRVFLLGSSAKTKSGRAEVGRGRGGLITALERIAAGCRLL